MRRKAPPEVEFNLINGTFRAVGGPALILIAVLAMAYLAMANWDKIFG